jgi:hypothetical protein
LAHNDVIVPIRADHLGSDSAALRTLTTPLSPKDGFLGAGSLFFLVQLLVREHPPEEGKALEPVLEAFGLGSQPLDLAAPGT